LLRYEDPKLKFTLTTFAQANGFKLEDYFLKDEANQRVYICYDGMMLVPQQMEFFINQKLTVFLTRPS
jgi:hypothetical protein